MATISPTGSAALPEVPALLAAGSEVAVGVSVGVGVLVGVAVGVSVGARVSVGNGTAVGGGTAVSVGGGIKVGVGVGSSPLQAAPRRRINDQTQDQFMAHGSPPQRIQIPAINCQHVNNWTEFSRKLQQTTC